MRSAFQMLDEQNLVAFFVINQLVHHSPGHQNAKAAWPESELTTHLRMRERIIRSVCNSRVRQSLERKPFARITNVVDDGALGPHERDVHVLFRIRSEERRVGKECRSRWSR